MLEECSENSGIIIKDSFVDLPSDLITHQTIYFIETTNSSNHRITARQACAIESAGENHFDQFF